MVLFSLSNKKTYSNFLSINDNLQNEQYEEPKPKKIETYHDIRQLILQNMENNYLKKDDIKQKPKIKRKK